MREDRTYYDEQEEIVPIETSGGAFSANTEMIHGLIRGVRVQPASAGTSYDITLTDKDDFVIYKRVSQIGEFVEPSVGIPVRGRLTMALANADADEIFKVVIHAEAV